MSGFVLLALCAEPRTIGEVGELLATTKQAAAKVVSALVEEELVQRRKHPRDRRAAALGLTDHGRRFVTPTRSSVRGDRGRLGRGRRPRRH